MTSVVTYFSMRSCYQPQASTTEENAGIMFWVGVLLIISAGSFLYVATLHILPEVLYDRDTHGHSHGTEKAEQLRHFSKGIELLAMVVGLVAPLGLTLLADE